MMMNKKLFAPVLLAILILLAGCQIETPTPSPTPQPVPTDTPQAQTPDPTDTPPALTPTPTASPDETPPPADELPPEAIMILSPGPGSRVTNPIRLAGEADSTFEQNLVIRVLLDDGTELLETYTTIQGEWGERGVFETEFEVALEEERNIFIQVFDVSARDGGVIHLSSTIAMFSPTGPEDIVVRTPEPERIALFAPQIGDTVSGGTAFVEGFGLASFEQTLVVEVYDEDGMMVGQTPVMVQAPDLGYPGPFEAEVEYTVAAPGPGRIVVRDISPAHGGDTHLTSVEVQLAP
jgi:hypothetical protein